MSLIKDGPGEKGPLPEARRMRPCTDERVEGTGNPGGTLRARADGQPYPIRCAESCAVGGPCDPGKLPLAIRLMVL